jgi:hypothetical protein
MSLHKQGANAPTGFVRPLSVRDAGAVCHPCSPDVARELTATSGMSLLERIEWLSQHELDGTPIPSREARLELLEAAFIYVVAELGCPMNEEAEALFDARLDALYRASLVARVPMRTPSFSVRLRAVLIEQKARAL